MGIWTFRAVFCVFFFSASIASTAEVDLKSHLLSTIEDGFDWSGFSIVAGGVAAVMLTQPHDFSHRAAWNDHQRISDSVTRIGDLLGTGLWGVSVTVAQYFLDRERSFSHAEALVMSFATTSLLKGLNGRNRPDSDNKHSMPSGHTSTSFTTATHLAVNYGLWVGIPSYAVATFVAATRWSDDAHWLSDTVAGAAIGIFWGRATAFHHLKNIQPVVERGVLGVQFSASY
ncbi:MAG: phosphatase PAP2 family protein [Bdellovibrionales bacterium]|nr:phosphatase PAP2 family protein [Bdellovibrionales bacterium]